MAIAAQHTFRQDLPPVGNDPREMTDRPFRFPARQHVSGVPAKRPLLDSKRARVRWMIQNRVETEFLDAGIGCCWFAYQDERVWSGETEHEALVRLARDRGLELWRESRSRDEGRRH